jgi:hypothetical protein
MEPSGGVGALPYIRRANVHPVSHAWSQVKMKDCTRVAAKPFGRRTKTCIPGMPGFLDIAPVSPRLSTYISSDMGRDGKAVDVGPWKRRRNRRAAVRSLVLPLYHRRPGTSLQA